MLIMQPFLRLSLGSWAWPRADFGLLNLDLDFGNNGKSLGCLYWGLRGAVRQADEYWSELALRAVSEERSELRKGD